MEASRTIVRIKMMRMVFILGTDFLRRCERRKSFEYEMDVAFDCCANKTPTLQVLRKKMKAVTE